MKRTLTSIGFVVLALALLITLAPACGNGDDGGDGDVKTVKIGFLMPLSGMAAVWGIQFEQGFDAAIDKINGNGGFKVGDDTYVIKGVKADSKFLGSAAATEAIRLTAEENIHYVVGPIITHLAVEPIFKEAKCFFTSSGTDTPLGPDYPYSFMMPAPTVPWSEAFWDLANEFHPEVKTVALITPDSQQYVVNNPDLVANHEAHGHEVVMVQTYAQNSVDFYPVLTQVAAKNPDAVDLDGGGHGDNDLIVKQLRELGYTGLIFGPMHGDPMSAVEIAGCEFAEGFATNDPNYMSDIYPEETQQIAAEIKQKYPEADLALTTYLSYSAVEMYVAAMQWAGSVDPDEVMKAFDDPDFEYTAFGIPGRKLGGFETYGIRRNWQDEVAYSEVIDCEKVMLSRKATMIP